MAQVLYGPKITDVMGTGNLEQMKEIARAAEELLAGREVQGYQAGEDEGDLEEALESLKTEINRFEGK